MRTGRTSNFTEQKACVPLFHALHPAFVFTSLILAQFFAETKIGTDACGQCSVLNHDISRRDIELIKGEKDGNESRVFSRVVDTLYKYRLRSLSSNREDVMQSLSSF